MHGSNQFIGFGASAISAIKSSIGKERPHSKINYKGALMVASLTVFSRKEKKKKKKLKRKYTLLRFKQT
jgi:hypothetical protein